MDNFPVSTSHCSEGKLLTRLHADYEKQRKTYRRRVFKGKVISPVTGYNCSNSKNSLTAL